MKKLFWAVGVLAVAIGAAAFWATSILESRYNRVRTRPPYLIPTEAFDPILWMCPIIAVISLLSKGPGDDMDLSW